MSELDSERDRAYVKWIINKLNQNSFFLYDKGDELYGDEAIKAVEELNPYHKDSNEESKLKSLKLSLFIEKNISQDHIKAMKAAYRKSKSRQKNKSRIADAIELPWDISINLADLAKDKNVTKRQYIYDLINTKHAELRIKQDKELREKVAAEIRADEKKAAARNQVKMAKFLAENKPE